jgi:EmrB/QacA subfamily drug resistance transporter
MRKWWPLVTICLGTFMLLVDVTIVNVALPDMAVDLQTSFTSLQWVIDAYALTLAALLLGIGSLADRFGHRRSYVIGLVIFAVASLACGLAPNANILIAARAVQGIGGAAMFATTFALINSSYQGRDRGTAYGMWGAIAGAAAAFGPIVGGILTQAISWRWIFFVNLPISVLAIALCFAVLAADAGVRGPRLDLAGTVTFTAFAGTLVYALILTGSDGWSSPIVWVLLAISVLSLLMFLAVERSSSHAMLDLSLFTSRSFVGLMVAALLINFAAFSAFTYTSLWLQSVIGLSPLQAGLTGLPLSLASFGVSAMIGRFLHRSHPGPIIGTGMVLIGLGSGLVAVLLHDSSSWPALIPGYVIIGVGVGLALPTLSSSAMGAVPIHRGGMAAGVVNTARQLGFALGIAVLGSVFAAGARQSLTGSNAPNSGKLADSLIAGQAHAVLAGTPPEQQPLVDHLLRAASTHGLDLAFGLAAIIGLIAGALVLGLVRPKAEAVAAAAPAGVAA